jgi:hypothetical protein
MVSRATTTTAQSVHNPTTTTTPTLDLHTHHPLPLPLYKMAEEPQPPQIQEGAATPSAPLPAGGDDRKAAAALSSLDAKVDDDAAPKKEIDLKALNDAMKTLEVASKPAAAGGEKKQGESGAPKKPLVKDDAADVGMLVSIL